jgi:hypothetical protein
MNDYGDLVGVGRIVGDAVGNRRGEDVALAVRVLKPLAVEGRAAGGAAQQEAAAARVAGSPREIANALKAEHRVEDVKRDHRQVVDAVGGGGGDP